MLRFSLGVAISLLLGTTVVADASGGAAIEKARQCGIKGDVDCSYGILIKLAEEGELGLEMEGHQSLSGAMLEASVIDGFSFWPAEKSRNAAQRYLSVLEQRAPESSVGYATAYGIIAMSCGAEGDSDCADKNIAALCAGSERLTAPMGDHPKYAKFTGQLVELLNNECGAPQ